MFAAQFFQPGQQISRDDRVFPTAGTTAKICSAVRTAAAVVQPNLSAILARVAQSGPPYHHTTF